MWIVDPLDGTKEFIKRNGEFTVNIALAEGGVPTMGVIYVPVTDTLYFADRERAPSRSMPVDRRGGDERPPGRGNCSMELIMNHALRMPLKREKGRPFTIMVVAPTPRRNWKHTWKRCGKSMTGWHSFRRAVP